MFGTIDELGTQNKLEIQVQWHSCCMEAARRPTRAKPAPMRRRHSNFCFCFLLFGLGMVSWGRGFSWHGATGQKGLLPGGTVALGAGAAHTPSHLPQSIGPVSAMCDDRPVVAKQGIAQWY